MGFPNNLAVMRLFSLDGGPIIQSSMTIIAISLTEQGFVVATDGREVREDHSVENDEVQKIFHVHNMGKSFAMMAHGTVGIGPSESDEVLMNILQESCTVAKQLAQCRTKDLLDYATKLAQPIKMQLIKLRSSNNIDRYPTNVPTEEGQPGNTIARVFLVGYHGGFPEGATIRFFHRNQARCEFEVNRGPLQALYGSKQMFDIVTGKAHDERLAKYKARYSPKLTLDATVDLFRTYIAACSDRAAEEIDDSCYAYGGRCQIAKLTQRAGFSWIDPPEQPM